MGPTYRSQCIYIRIGIIRRKPLVFFVKHLLRRSQLVWKDAYPPDRVVMVTEAAGHLVVVLAKSGLDLVVGSRIMVSTKCERSRSRFIQDQAHISHG